MAVIIARQKMAIRHAGGKHTIFPSAEPQSLPDHLLNDSHVAGGIESGWITVLSVEPIETKPEAEKKESAPARKRRSA